MKRLVVLTAAALAIASARPAPAVLDSSLFVSRGTLARVNFVPILQKFERSMRTLDQSVTSDQGRYYEEEAELRAPLEREMKWPFGRRSLTDADLKYDVQSDGYYWIRARQVVKIKRYRGRLDWRGRKERASLKGPVLAVPCELRYVQVVRVRVFIGNVYDKPSRPRPLGIGVLREEPVDLRGLLKGSRPPAR